MTGIFLTQLTFVHYSVSDLYLFIFNFFVLYSQQRFGFDWLCLFQAISARKTKKKNKGKNT